MEEPVKSKENKTAAMLHHHMAAVGGFMAGYAMLMRADFLGNAQTANWIYLVFALLGRDIPAVLIRFGALLLYVAAAMGYVFIKNKTAWNIRRISIGIDILAVLILGMIPESVTPALALYPVFFSMSFQWNAFPGAYGYVSSPIFSTNNTKQVSLSIAEYLCGGSKAYLHKAGFFLGSLLGFHIGVAFSYFMVHAFTIRAIYWNLLLLLIASVWLLLLEKEEGVEHKHLRRLFYHEKTHIDS